MAKKIIKVAGVAIIDQDKNKVALCQKVLIKVN